MLTEGLRDIPTKLARLSPAMTEIPQTLEHREFGSAHLLARCATGVYKRMDTTSVHRAKVADFPISSAFTHWQGEGTKRKGRFVINLGRTNVMWEPAPMQMEKVELFAEDLQEKELMISFDLVAGYRHVQLHEYMLDFFIFK